MLSQARDLASSHGCTVLQTVQEWHSSKGSSKAMPLGEVIEKFLADKSNRSPAYTPIFGYFSHILALTGQSTGLGPTKSKIFWIPKRQPPGGGTICAPKYSLCSGTLRFGFAH